MKRTLTLLSLTALAAACGSEDPSGPAAEPRASSGLAVTIDVAPRLEAEPPAQLSCVSEVAGGGHEVWRLELFPSEDGALASLRGGKQFRSHERGQRYDADVEIAQMPATLVVEDGALRLEATDGDQHLSATLSPDGLAFRGELLHDQCYAREARAVTCWDPLTVWGGFGGDPTVATFDFSAGRCLDAKGEPALNALPVEVVRETGMGDCADLRGAALNGEDFGYPQLSFWSLRGADLRGARLHFADLESAGLQGANLSSLEFGYATITGSFSDQTRLPEAGCERTGSDNPWAGPQLRCAR